MTKTYRVTFSAEDCPSERDIRSRFPDFDLDIESLREFNFGPLDLEIRGWGVSPRNGIPYIILKTSGELFTYLSFKPQIPAAHIALELLNLTWDSSLSDEQQKQIIGRILRFPNARIVVTKEKFESTIRDNVHIEVGT